jgi:hypothetical protein
VAGDEIAPRRSSGPGFLDRIAATFVAPGENVSAETSAIAMPQVAVLCAPADVWVVGGAAALSHAGVAVVAGWGAPLPSGRAPGTPSAQRLAAALAARGHTASASGRLVRVALDGSGAEITAEIARLAAAADPAPCVAALAGPRDERVDALLAAQDRVLVHAPDDLADIAVESVAPLAPARRLELGAAPATARALAASGLALVPPVRAAVEEALR